MLYVMYVNIINIYIDIKKWFYQKDKNKKIIIIIIIKRNKQFIKLLSTR